jgi:hypothetical protein
MHPLARQLKCALIQSFNHSSCSFKYSQRYRMFSYLIFARKLIVWVPALSRDSQLQLPPSPPIGKPSSVYSAPSQVPLQTCFSCLLLRFPISVKSSFVLHTNHQAFQVSNCLLDAMKVFLTWVGTNCLKKYRHFKVSLHSISSYSDAVCHEAKPSAYHVYCRFHQLDLGRCWKNKQMPSFRCLCC